MERLKRIDFDEYARWYLAREVREKRRLPIPNLRSARAAWMKIWHGGKMVPWFESRAEWWICRLTTMAELESLLVLPSPWTRAAGIVRPDEPRILVNAARRAQQAYFHERSPEEVAEMERRADRVGRCGLSPRQANDGPLAVPRMLAYYRRHQNGFRIDGDDAVVLRSLEDDERREMERWNCRETRYYLHDGLGRLLSYMVLLQREIVDFRPVTAIVAERLSDS
jgi:hypothetical protein